MKKTALKSGAVCLSIAGSTSKECLDTAARCQGICDVIEIRLDTLTTPQAIDFVGKLQKPLLFTNRCINEGGHFQGSEEERFKILDNAVQAGADLIDVELKSAPDKRQAIIDSARHHGCQSIVSWHNFTTTPSRQALESILQEQYRSSADIGKIVTMASSFQDVLTVLGLQTLAAELGFPLIAFCMGAAGAISRFATLELGGFMTYAAPDVAAATAPGQLSITAIDHLRKALHHAD